METVNQNEVLLKNKKDWLYFRTPDKIIVAEKLEDVTAALNEVEREVEQHGLHAAGFVSYEAASAFEPSFASHPTNGFPYLWFGLYPEPACVTLPPPARPKPALDWQPAIDREKYRAAIDQIKESIAQGKTYQVNYTMRLHARFEANAWDFFLHFAQAQNQYGAYLDTGRYVICSASPELFFELDEERITARPMKGTARRGRTSQEDQAQADWLRNSEKNRAENVMIVDMIRNDLGRIAHIGSVHVPELFKVERYPTLWQMTSTVTARTSASLSGIFNALFPCASITGAPKVSTMKIIRELEATPRRIYTGTIGYLSPGRQARFNVAIRTTLLDREEQRAEYGVGGGIVWDSTSSDEYAEALLKARVLTASSPSFSLLETLLWTPGKNFFLQDRHIERLLNSADYFGFAISRDRLEETLRRAATSYVQPQRVRMLVDREGNVEITAVPFFAESTPVHASLAEMPVDSSDVFLFHKTTQRAVYERALASHPEHDDTLLYNEHRELTEFTIGNLVVELDGDLLTPPIESGLLPGTFRAHLLETGQVVERIVPLHRLKECTKVYRVNSVRGWETVIIG